MLTGDNQQTAEYIASLVGIDDVRAQVLPHEKEAVIRSLQTSGERVAMCGDGVNDAPALKRADIGVAMGRVGSDVAKESAEIVLLDDSFHTLIGAIQQGRVIFQNIRKATLSCLTSNAGELVVVLISLAAASLLHVPIAITVIQILAIDLMAELFPIAALGWDPPTSNIMSEKPRNIKDHILNLRAILDLLGGGIVIGGLAYLNFLVVFAIAHKPVSTSDPLLYAQATTVAYLTIVICQYVTVLSRRTAHGESMFSKYLFSNWHLWGAIGLSFGCVLAITYVPTLAKFIGNGPVTLMQWLPVLVASVIYLCLRELFKVRWRLTAS
jgi:Ca2+-transporting ATPase